MTGHDVRRELRRGKVLPELARFLSRRAPIRSTRRHPRPTEPKAAA